MKTNLLLYLFLLASALAAQERGVTPVGGTKTAQAGSTRAVVVGISDYQDPAIPDLRFADKDAEAFAQYLRSPAGGSVPDANIKLLTNEKATMAAVAAALDWLVEVCAPGDQAIIYFSGHGDVEAKTSTQPGFLLTYDSPPKVYIAGAYPLFYLQLIVQTLSTDKDVQTLVITDACHAGKLAGSDIGGAQATAANLAKQYGNEVKILSCQPNEFSMEGEQWGGGRGAFSYHLIEGLVGLADRNTDEVINLHELENYLDDRVPAETAPNPQYPLAIGNKTTQLAVVDEAVLAKLKDLKNKQLPTMAAIESKGFETTLLAQADSSVREKYEAFLAALDGKNLLDGEHSADALYRELMIVPNIEALQRLMNRQLATALQDDAQQAVNAYLLATPTELGKRWKGDTTYAQYPRYLQRAAELLGENHYMHNYLLAKKLYFEGLGIRLKAERGDKGSTYGQAIEKQEAALALESRAAFIYNELGVLNTRLINSEKAVSYYEKAIELAPEWGLPYVNLCLEYHYNNEQEKALETGEKAIERMPNYPELYNLMGWINVNYFRDNNKSSWPRAGVELTTDFRYIVGPMSTMAQKKKSFRRAIEYLEKAIEIDSNFAVAHANIGELYHHLDQLNKAVFHLKKAVNLDSTIEYAFGNLGFALGMQHQYDEAEAVCDRAIELAQKRGSGTAAMWYCVKGIYVYRPSGKRNKEKNSYLEALKTDPTGFVFPFLSEYYAAEGESAKAELFQLKSLARNPYNPMDYLRLGRLYISLHRNADAEWMFHTALALRPDYLDVIVEMVEWYQTEGKKDVALKCQQQLMEIGPDDPLSYVTAGKLAFLNRQPEKAHDNFQKAVALDSAEWSYLNDIGDFYCKHSDFEKARSCLLKAVALDPPYISPNVNLAVVNFDQGLKEAGEAWLDSAWVKYRDPSVWVHKMYLLLYREDYDEAEAALLTLVEQLEQYKGLPPVFNALKHNDYSLADSLMNVMPDSLVNLHPYFQARIQTCLGRPEKAVELLKRNTDFPYGMIARDTFFASLHGTPDFESLMRRNYPEKYNDLDTFEFTEAAPRYYPESCVRLAEFYETQSEQERAKFLYEKVIELKPDTLTTQQAFLLAKVYLKLGKLEDARAIFPKDVESDDVEQHLSIGQLHYRLGRTDKAEEHFEAYVHQGTQNYRAQQVGWFYANHGECGLSEKYYRKALEIFPEFQGPYWDLGWLYFSCGDTKKALEAMDEGIKDFPDNFDLKGIKAMILALSDPSDQPGKAFETLEKERPDLAQVGTCLNLMQAKKYEEATAAYQSITKEIKDWWVARMLNFAYVRMSVAKGDLDAAMDVIDRGDTWIFSYPLLYGDTALAPLRETEQFEAFVRKHFPEKYDD